MPLVRGETKHVREEIHGEVTYHGVYEPQRYVRTTRWKYIRRFDDALAPRSAEGGAWPRTSPFEQSLPNTGPGISRDVMIDYGVGARLPAAEELFDLALDPMERVNVAADPACGRVLAHMRARLERWMRESGNPLLAGVGPGVGPDVKN